MFVWEVASQEINRLCLHLLIHSGSKIVLWDHKITMGKNREAFGNMNTNLVEPSTLELLHKSTGNVHICFKHIAPS